MRRGIHFKQMLQNLGKDAEVNEDAVPNNNTGALYNNNDTAMPNNNAETVQNNNDIHDPNGQMPGYQWKHQQLSRTISQ